LNNFGMEIENEGIQARVKAIVFKWILLWI
jgi:hypothetical protein